jgi:hypothetical protein
MLANAFVVRSVEHTPGPIFFLFLSITSPVFKPEGNRSHYCCYGRLFST